jgi:hypothetical protein
MAGYFSYFPDTFHDLRNSGRKTQVTNILRRFKVKDVLQDRADIFYEYSIQEGDRPDVIAEKFYGNANYAWIVLHYNDIIDPFFDWPLFGNDFRRFIIDKYGSLSSAQSTVKNYYKIIREARVLNDGTRLEKVELAVDLTTYNSLAANVKRSESAYDWEVERNEERKQIRLLEPRYVSQAIDEVETILQDT